MYYIKYCVLKDLLIDGWVVLLYVSHADGRGFPCIVLHRGGLKLYRPDVHVVVTETHLNGLLLVHLYLQYKSEIHIKGFDCQ